MHQRQTITLSIIAAIFVVTAVIVFVVRGSNIPRATNTIATTTTTIALSGSTPSPTLMPIHGPKGDREVFSALGTAISQGTGQIPSGEVVTLYYACLGTAKMYISVGNETLLVTPCINEVGFAEVLSATVARDVVITSPTTDRWRVVAFAGSH